jgi:hypothetical protein
MAPPPDVAPGAPESSRPTQTRERSRSSAKSRTTSTGNLGRPPASATAGTSFDPTRIASKHFGDASDSPTRRSHPARVIPFGDDMKGCHHGICKT